MASMSRWSRSCRVPMLDIAASCVFGPRRLRTGLAKAKRRRRLGEGPSGPGDRVQGIAAVKRGSAHGVSREDYDVDELVAVVRRLRMKPPPSGHELVAGGRIGIRSRTGYPAHVRE